MKPLSIVIIVVILAVVGMFFLGRAKNATDPKRVQTTTSTSTKTNVNNLFPLSIAAMREKSYPGSDITIEQTLPDGTNYHQYVVSYASDGLKQYALLTVPTGNRPANGWPAILLNHGYIPPSQYSTTDSYAVAVQPLASNGYIVFKPDYRGNGQSEGKPTQIYVSSDYVTDSLNALASLKKYKDVNPKKIGVWGHSMGGNVTLHELVITHDFKAAVIWAGVVGSYTDILAWWDQRGEHHSIVGNDLDTVPLINELKKEHGTPQSNPDFWNSIDPTNFLKDITTPIQIQVGTGDNEVPTSFSESLNKKLQADGKSVTFFEYPGADHNLSPDSSQAMSQSISFFDKYLK